jgi:hypothetical protein
MGAACSTEAMTNHYDHITKDDLDALAKAQSAKILTLLKASNM